MLVMLFSMQPLICAARTTVAVPRMLPARSLVSTSPAPVLWGTGEMATSVSPLTAAQTAGMGTAASTHTASAPGR